ncbi:hypothetical protein B0H66DRAFT_68206 [Apodospora peruviana]|uniref:3-carboxymuconate cyclase n=1 Tax=Apodospora peruviana TaxID=516989 RepID=A0AAE0MGY4_9PEZI|nr:hypothetical protein B0H66DRAFT_68206 [Apodospora peruviana]
MHSLIRYSLVATAVLGMAGGVASRPSARQAAAAGAANAKAFYFITNNEENTVAAVELGADGLVTGKATVLATGGAGANGIDGSTNKSAVPDALFSQSALTIAGMNIFAVNAGSNSISMLAINPADPLKLRMVGDPVVIPGEFPNTVAASEKLGLVCVGLTGKKAGVSCASFSSEAGVGEMDELRGFELNQSTPPVGPTNTVSHVFFSSDETQLLATVKGDPAKNNTGFIAAYAVEQKTGGRNFKRTNNNETSAGGEKGAAAAAAAVSVSRDNVRSSPEGTAVLFGSVAIPGASAVLVTDASFGVAILNIDGTTGKAETVAKVALADQKATCWSAISPATGTAFVTDVGINRLVEVGRNGGGELAVLNEVDMSVTGDPGVIDLRAGGELVYALSPGNGTTQAAVSVVNVVTKKLLQSAKLSGLGAGANSMGMALLI